MLEASEPLGIKEGMLWRLRKEYKEDKFEPFSDNGPMSGKNSKTKFNAGIPEWATHSKMSKSNMTLACLNQLSTWNLHYQNAPRRESRDWVVAEYSIKPIALRALDRARARDKGNHTRRNPKGGRRLHKQAQACRRLERDAQAFHWAQL